MTDTKSEYAGALDGMPSLHGTPDTTAYTRSNERCAQWYDQNYKTIRRALRLADALERGTVSNAALNQLLRGFDSVGSRTIIENLKAMMTQLKKVIDDDTR